MFLNFNRMLEREMLILVVQQLKDNFSIACMNFSTWFNTVYWVSGQTTLSVAHKFRLCKPGMTVFER